MSELPLKATLKAAGGFDAPWLTVDGADPDDINFKLKSIANHPELSASLIEAANALKAAYNAGPLLTNGPDATEAPAPQEQPKQQGWGSTPAAAQQTQQVPQQRHVGGQQRNYGGTPHPEGKGCEMCGKTLERKTTQSGKAKWQCPDWRWNNGNPNGHSQEWID